MTTKEIELLATTAVKESVILSDHLFPYVSENDKEPSWDGHIYIYSSTTKIMDYFTGRVPVQVKGTTKPKNMNAAVIKHSVKVNDLKHYLKDGGTVYFVVVIKGLERKIYYINLTPVKLIQIIEDAASQAKIKLKFEEFPNDPRLKSNIILNFYQDCKKQASFSKETMVSVDDLRKSNDLQLTASVTGYGYSTEKREKAFLENEVYLYATKKGTNIAVPVLMDPSNMFIVEKPFCDIYANGKKHYSSFKITKNRSNSTITIGESIRFNPSDMLNEPGTIQYTPSPSLRAQVKDLEFILDAMEDGGFYFDKRKVELTLNKQQKKEFNIEENKKRLHSLKRVLELFDILHITKDLNLNEITEWDNYRLNYLITAICDGELISNLKPDLPITRVVTIQNINILLFFKEQDTKGTYHIFDYFSSDSDIVVLYDSKDSDEKFITSIFSSLKPENYNMVDNLNYDLVVSSFTKIYNTSNKDVWEAANNCMLDLLKAFDQSKNPRQLEVAEELNDWVMLVRTDDDEISKLNHIQIQKRKRDLSSEEISYLCEVVEDTDNDSMVKAAAYLLMDNSTAAKIHMSKLDEKEMEVFKNYPIFTFFKE